jgi:hypothetical protein
MDKIETQFDPNIKSDFGTSGTINFQQPAPDTEDQGEIHMPLRHRCDACRIMSIMFAKKLQDLVINA